MAEFKAEIALSRPLGRWDLAFMVEPRGICEGTVWLEGCEEGLFAAVMKKIVRRGSATTTEALPALTIRSDLQLQKGKRLPRPLPPKLLGLQEIRLLPGGRGALQTPIERPGTPGPNDTFHFRS